ncbi:SHIRT domain-containing protein, partial [Streptococcus cristatus]|uniref:SHIRT domain-containing protein n=3 Tax=Streptococcus TaxID=1301 RepID=UPI00065FCCBC
ATYENGNTVSAQQPAQATYTDTVNDGTWTFKGYNAASAVVNKSDVEFVGKWAFEANKYQATYRFESATAGKAFPAAIAALTPSDSARYVNGASVSAQQPSQTTYTDAVNDGTWTFKGYDAASAVVNKADVEFVGKWAFEAQQVPSPQPQPEPAPQPKPEPKPELAPQPQPVPKPEPQPSPVPPVTPEVKQAQETDSAAKVRTDQLEKKPESKPVPNAKPAVPTPAGDKAKQTALPNTGSTAPVSIAGATTSALLAGLGFMILGRKRKDDEA